MIRLDYPEFDFRIKKEAGRELIFDPLRKQWVKLSPEEWVRQNMLQFLVQVSGYPAGLIAVEKEIRLGELRKRFDILIYNQQQQPWMMVECKAMSVQLSGEVLHQLLRYHIAVPVSYLVITNGRYCAGYHKLGGQLLPISEFPAFGN